MHSRKKNRTAAISASLTAILIGSLVMAQPSNLTWHTVDAGGATFSTGGGFTVGGTIGQPDATQASVLTGGGFTLSGGFWTATTLPCHCPGDINGDGQRNGRDIHQFTLCVITASPCDCAETDGVPGLNAADVSTLVTSLMNSASCP